MPWPCVLLLFVVSSTILPLQAVRVCHIRPPYRNLHLISFTPKTHRHATLLPNLLKKFCSELHLLAPERLTLHLENFLIVTHPQLHALHNSKPPISFRYISSNLTAVFSRAPKQNPYYLRSSPSLSSSTSSSVRSTPRSVLPLDTQFYHQFHTYHILAEKCRAIASNYSSHVTLTSIGKSHQSRPILALTIGKTDSKNPRRIFLNGLQHAREWVAAAVPIYAAEQLAVAAAEGGNSNLANLLNVVQVIVVPVVNPDGYIYSGTNRDWRKNRASTSKCNEKNSLGSQGPGVDLNRNWATDYGGSGSTSLDPCSDVYIGTSPFSEPETAAVRDFVLRTKGLKAHIDFHSYGQLVLGTWSFTDDQPPRAEEIDIVGTTLQDDMTNAEGAKYRFGRGANNKLMYPASGTMVDWMFAQGVLSFTVELRPSSPSEIVGFRLPESLILPTCEESMAAVTSLLTYAENQTLYLESNRFRIEGSSSNGGNDNNPNTPDRNQPSAPQDTLFIVGISLGGAVLAIIVVMIIAVGFQRRMKKRAANVENASSSASDRHAAAP